MKKFLVIGNPIEHSLSPKLHNYWIEKNNLKAFYEKRKLNEEDIKNIIQEIRNNNITGINVTVPFKKLIIPFVDELTDEAKQVQSVNTIYKKEDKIIGENTDARGFQEAIKMTNYTIKGKKIFILGAGGVASSLIYSLINMGATNITLSNRTIEKTKYLKEMFPSIKIIQWGKETDFDMILNATSLGLENETIQMNYQKHKSKFFYDIIYNPPKTNFLKGGEKFKNKIENGKLMFIFQAQLAFKIWHGINPKIDKEVLDLI